MATNAVSLRVPGPALWRRLAGGAAPLLFLLASNAATLSVFAFGLWLWPERLPVNSQNIFWLASGVNLAGLLLLGLRYGPLLLLNAFPAWLLIGEPLDLCLLGAAANALEAVLGAWLIRRNSSPSPGPAPALESLRSIGALVIASLVAPLANTLLIPAYLCAKGTYPWSEYGHALGNWNLSNGTAILIVTPLLLSLLRPAPAPDGRGRERLLAACFCAAFSYLAFSALFAGKGMNIAFLAFLPILYLAVRFGLRETALGLGITLAGLYAALITHSHAQPLPAIPALVWFTQTITWVLAATGLLLAVLGTERREAERRSLQASVMAGQARLAALRYQINPHFLFNALNSIRSTLPLSETTPRDMITTLSGYLRATLETGDATHVPLRDEVHQLTQYLRIEQHRFGPDLIPSFDIPANTASLPVPSFLLQPLVENAIRHGLEKNPGPCRITLRACRTGGELHLTVANTGPWREPHPAVHTGLENIRRRLQLLYGPAASLAIEAGAETVRIHLILPL